MLPYTNHYFLSIDVTFFKDSSTSLPSVLLLDVIPLPVIFPSLDLYSPFTDILSQPLQIYTRCHHIGTRSLADSSCVSSSFPTLVPQPPDDVRIALQKGT